jgi:DNA-binding NtrC family response regulator
VLEPLASTSVLLIEDDANVVRVLVALLQPACTTSASSLEEAKQAFSVENDLIISDLALGEESGLDMLSWVLNTHPEFTDRFVLISGDASRLEALKPTLPEGVRVLAKPVSQDNLWRLFREKESSS